MGESILSSGLDFMVKLSRSERAKRAWRERIVFQRQHPAKGRDVLLRRVVRRGRTLAILNRDTVAILRYCAFRRRTSAISDTRPIGFSRLSDAIETILARRENRGVRPRSVRFWTRRKLEKTLTRIRHCEYPAALTRWCVVSLRCGLDPVTLKPREARPA